MPVQTLADLLTQYPPTIVREPTGILIGDGAGSGEQVGCGWSCVIYDLLLRRWDSITGGNCRGTISYAEIMALFDGARIHCQATADLAIRQRLVAYSDSRSVVHAINRRKPVGGYRVQLAGLEELRRLYNMTLEAVWIPRETVLAHNLVDQLSVAARLAMETFRADRLAVLTEPMQTSVPLREDT